MTGELDTTYLGALLSWAETETISLNRNTTENQWLSLPVPTRRFGPDSWVMFSMRNTPGEPLLGPFTAWIVLDNAVPRVIAYLESPIADTFGVVEPFGLAGPGAVEDSTDLLAKIAQAGAAFFERSDASADHAAAADGFLAHFGGDLADRLRDAAPDFFAWASRGRPVADDDEAS